MPYDPSTTVDDYMSVVVTHRCDRNCRFCIDQYHGNDEDITIKSVYKAMHLGYEKQTGTILITGGEPTLHPDIVEICELFRAAEFHVVVTTNYGNPDIVKKLDGIAHDINISWYDQDHLPNQADFESRLTLTALIYRRRLDSKDLLDRHINAFDQRFDALKFSTLEIANSWCEVNRDGSFLDFLPGERMVLFNEILGQEYRGAIIKRYDRKLNPNAEQSIKFHVDGTWSRSWDRGIIS